MPNAAPSLFDQPVERRRRRASETQADGLKDVLSRAPTQDALVLDTLRAYGRLTRHEIADVTSLPLASVCRAVNTLIGSARAFEPIVDGAVVRRVGTNRALVEAL